MKKFVLIIFFYLFTLASNSNSEDKINIGIFLGFSGLVETLTPSMADSIELPFKEIVSLENFFNKGPVLEKLCRFTHLYRMQIENSLPDI